MFKFKKTEVKIILAVFAGIVIASMYNFKLALMRARDTSRKDDIRDIAYALLIYGEEFGFYPPSSEEGMIVACQKESIPDNIDPNMDLEKRLNLVFRSCNWGNDSLIDPSDSSRSAYLENIPKDPRDSDGYLYKYFSNTRQFQIYAHLENKDDDSYEKSIEDLNRYCGSVLCNFGRSSNNIPLDITIKEYEETLLEK